jgi:hypothetical protein
MDVSNFARTLLNRAVTHLSPLRTPKARWERGCRRRRHPCQRSFGAAGAERTNIASLGCKLYKICTQRCNACAGGAPGADLASSAPRWKTNNFLANLHQIAKTSHTKSLKTTSKQYCTVGCKLYKICTGVQILHHLHPGADLCSSAPRSCWASAAAQRDVLQLFYITIFADFFRRFAPFFCRVQICIASIENVPESGILTT